MLMQDIKRERRSLKEILPKRNSRAIPVVNQVLPEEDMPTQPPNYPPQTTRRGGSGKWWLLLLVLIIVGLGGFIFFQHNAKATVQLTVKQFEITLNDDVEASRVSASSTPQALLFDIVRGDVLSESTTLPATGSKQVSQSATGKVILYNKTTTSQKLIATTRLETPEGKIYRIPTAVTIPAAKKVGADVIPGSLEITINADKPGADYNIGVSDFTVPGLKGDPRYEQIYGRSKTPMTGGLVGAMATVDSKAEAAARQELRQVLSTKLLAALKERLPSRAWLSDQAVFVEFEPSAAATVVGDAKQATITESAQAWGIIFDKANLAQHLAKLKAPEATGGELTINNLEAVKLELKNPTSLTADSAKVAFHLTGVATIVPNITIAELQNELAGASKNQIEIILQHFPLIDSANVILRPPWLRELPAKDRIDIQLDRR